MEYITEVFKLDKKFPFTVFKGKGFSAEAVKNGKVYMHNHYCLEINLALSSGGNVLHRRQLIPHKQKRYFCYQQL